MSPSKQSRMYWMDALRGLAVLLVVLQHSTSFPKQRGTDLQFSVIDVSADVLAPYRMPLLLLLSGMLLGPSVHKSLKPYYTGKVRKIVWPLLVWGMITAVSDAELPEILTVSFWLSGPLHLWFLGVLIVYYGIGPVTRWVPAWVIVGVLFIYFAAADPSVFLWRRLLYYAIFFFLGAALHPHLARLQKRGVWFPISMGILGVAVSLGSAVNWIEVHPHREFWSLLAPLPGIAAILWLGPRLPRMRWLETAGRRSLVIYVAHFPIMVALTNTISDMGEMAPFAFYSLMLGLGLGIPLVLCMFYRYTKWLFELPSLSNPLSWRYEPDWAMPELSSLPGDPHADRAGMMTNGIRR